MGPPPIAGIRREPSFNFFPDAHVFASPDQLTPEDWEFQNVESRPTYAPIWADQLSAAHRSSGRALSARRLGVHRRGVRRQRRRGAATNRDRPASSRPSSIAAASFRHSARRSRRRALSVVSTLMAPWRPMIISLEVLDSANHAAGRMRFAPKLPVAGHATEPFGSLAVLAARFRAEIAHRGRAARVARADGAQSNRQIGIFWETYGVRPEGETFDYALEVEPVDEGLIHRALVKTARHGSGSGAQPSVARVPSIDGRDRVARRDGGSVPPQTRTVSRAADADVRDRLSRSSPSGASRSFECGRTPPRSSPRIDASVLG